MKIKVTQDEILEAVATWLQNKDFKVIADNSTLFLNGEYFEGDDEVAIEFDLD